MKSARGMVSACMSSITGSNAAISRLKGESPGDLTPSPSPIRKIVHYANGLPLPLAFPKLKLREVHYEGHIAALEDKIVQAAVVAILTPIYEAEFLGFSYGFRPGRNQHHALDAFAFGIGKRRINWVLDADIQAFFDTVNQDWLIRFVEHRIGDRRVVRLIRKWLAAGVLEEDQLIETEQGTPQGAVISPLLANIYLHYVYDLWVHRWRQRCVTGGMIVVRYADDSAPRRRKEEATM